MIETPVGKITGNTLAQVLGKALIVPLRLLLLALLARMLHQKGFGEYNLVLTVVLFLTLLVDLGVSDIVVREGAKRWQAFEERLGDLLVLKSGLALAAAGAAVPVMAWLDASPEVRRVAFVASLSLLGTAAGSIGHMAYRIRLEMKFSALCDLAAEILYLLIVLFLVARGGSLLAVVVGFVLSRWVHGALMLGVLVRRCRPRTGRPDPRRMLSLARVSLPVWASQVTGVIYGYVDILMLSRMQGEAAVGIYSASSGPVYQSVFLPLALVHSVFPLLCRSFVEDRDAMKALFQKTLDALVFLALPMAAGVTLFSGQIVAFLYGPEYAASAGVLRILIWAAVGMHLCTLAPLSLIALGQQGKILLFGAAGVVINVALNLLWIPAHSYVGASYATLVTEFATTLPALALICAHMRLVPSLRASAKAALAAAGAVLLVCCVPAWPTLVRAGLGAAVYLGLNGMLRTFSGKELRRVLGRERRA